MIIIMYQNGRKVSEIPWGVLHEEGWSLPEFVDIQTKMDRTLRITNLVEEKLMTCTN